MLDGGMLSYITLFALRQSTARQSACLASVIRALACVGGVRGEHSVRAGHACVDPLPGHGRRAKAHKRSTSSRRSCMRV